MTATLFSPMPLYPLQQAADSIRGELDRIHKALWTLEEVLPLWAEPYLLGHSPTYGLALAVRCATDHDVASIAQALLDCDEVGPSAVCHIAGGPFRLNATIAGVRFLCFVDGEAPR